MSPAMNSADDFISCPLCDGRGALANSSPQPCIRCRGKGAVTTPFAAHTRPELGRMPWEARCPDCGGSGQQRGPTVVVCAMCSGQGAIPRAAIAVPIRYGGR